MSDRSQAVRQLSNLIASERDDRRRPHLLSRLYSALKSVQDADPHIPILKQARAEWFQGAFGIAVIERDQRPNDESKHRP